MRKSWNLGDFDELAHEEGGVLVGVVAGGGTVSCGAGEFGVDVLVAECGGDGLAGVWRRR